VVRVGTFARKDDVAVKLQLSRIGSLETPAPKYQSTGAAGMDLHAALSEPATVRPGSRLLVPTGFAMAIEPGYEGQVRPRSGLALRHGVTVLNSPGTIDSDYRGEVKVVLINHGDQPFVVEPAMRIAQLVIGRVEQADVELVEQLDATDRGAGGYGSTGA
jgi:dUTP pyrophosphatase